MPYAGNKSTQKMKRIAFLFLIVTACFSKVNAQDNDYHATMKEVVDEIQSAPFGTDLTDAANQMERIAAVEKKEWLPLYWAAFCYMLNSYAEPSSDKKDLLLEKCETLLAAADSLSPTSDELAVLRANVASARLSVDPMNRWQKYGALSAAAIAKAKSINAANPRIALHEAQGIFYMPEAYGGGKQKALPLIKTAVEQFGKFKPTSDIMPNWGESVAKYMLAEAEK